MHRNPGTSTVLALAAALVCGGAAEGAERLSPEVADRIRPVVPAAVEYYNARSDDPLTVLGAGEVEALLRGEVVRHRRRPRRDVEDPPERVTGYRIVLAERSAVWIAALDPEFQATDLLTERRLRTFDDGGSLWHQYLSLPWPLADRQWVIRVGPDVDLAQRSDGLIWEQRWQLADGGEEIARQSLASGEMDGLGPDDGEGAVYVPANSGSWILFRLEPGITLVAYRVIARVGGSIPDSWITGLGMAQLAGVLDAVARHAGEVPGAYDPDRDPMIGGDGELIGRF